MINEYKSAYQLIIDDNIFKLESIKLVLEALKQRIDDHKSLKEDLEKFSIELEVIRENLTLTKLKSDLEELKLRKEQTEAAKTKIDLAHLECGNIINNGIKEHFNTDLINRIHGKIDPHPGLKEIEISSEISEDDKAAKIQIRAKNKFDRVNPVFYFSTGQVNVLSLSIFFAKAFELGSDAIDTIFMDDPVQNLSDINVLSFIDLLRTLIEEKDKQIVISTHDEKFFRLLQNKLSQEYFKAKYFELISYGELKDTVEN